MSADLTSQETMVENGMQLSLVSDPQKQIDQATRACEALMKIVESKKLYQDIGSGKSRKRHLMVEAWLLLGHFFGVTTRTESVMSVQDDATGHFGFEATVEGLHLNSGRILGRAVARCMSNEENWGMVAKYEWENNERTQVGERQKAMQQLESMAQTRATGKVLSSLFRWVVILGAPNVSGTPAEELGGGAEKKKAAQEGGAKRISDAQRKRIFAIAHQTGYPIDNLPALAQKHGFSQVFEITAGEKYDAIVAEVQNWKAVP